MPNRYNYAARHRIVTASLVRCPLLSNQLITVGAGGCSIILWMQTITVQAIADSGMRIWHVLSLLQVKEGQAMQSHPVVEQSLAYMMFQLQAVSTGAYDLT